MINNILKYLNEIMSADNSINENEYPRNKNKHWKFVLVVFVVALGMIGVIVRLFFVQVIDGEKYQNLAKRQHEKKMLLPAQRGLILDRNGNVLATNIMTLSIAIDPKISTEKEAIIDLLSNNLNLNKNELLKKVKGNKRFVWMVRGVNPDDIIDIYDIIDKGLILIDEPRRYYPYGEVASQIVGYTNIDNKGISGIEYLNDSSLKGLDGFVMLQKDAKQRLYASAELPKQDPINGFDINLTIDVDLQRILEYELEEGIKWSDANSGIGIAIKPQTGEILALANYPYFNPNQRNSISDENTKLRAITDEYAPGSTFKIVTTAAGLQENIISELDTVNGFNGELVFSWGKIRDVHGFSKTTFKEAVWQSSNIVMSSIADQIEDGKFYSYVRNFGFGNQLDIDLPGEISGKVKRPEKFYKSSKRYMGHGYDLTATPLQVVNAYASVANDGVMMQPFLLKKIYNNNEVLLEKQPIKIRNVIDKKTATRVKDLFVGVVDSGSGKRASIKGMKIAGKTGTSQKINQFGKYSKSEYYASFAGFFPADNPEVALLIIVDTPKKSIYGGVNSAPIFREIARRWMQLKANTIKTQELIVKSDSLIAPNLIGMDYRDLNVVNDYFNLKFKTDKDDGIVFFQTPKQGQVIEEESVISIKLIDKNKDNFVGYDLRGMPLRRALNFLHSSGIKTKVIGSGNVYKQEWSKKDKVIVCTLICK